MQKKLLTGIALATLILTSQTSAVSAQSKKYGENASQTQVEQQEKIKIQAVNAKTEENQGPFQVIRNRFEEKKEEIIEKRDGLEEKAQEKRDELQEKAQQTRAQILAKHAERLRHRFMEVYAERLGNIFEKAQRRFTIMAENGKDMTIPQAKLDEAKAKLEEATQYANSSITQFEAINADTYETQKNLALAARDTANQAREAFKATLGLLKEAIRLAKEV